MTARECYSSKVEMFLIVGHARLEVAQATNDTIILRDDPGFELSGSAELVVIVDGEEIEYHVLLWKPAPEARGVLSYS